MYQTCHSWNRGSPKISKTVSLKWLFLHLNKLGSTSKIVKSDKKSGRTRVQEHLCSAGYKKCCAPPPLKKTLSFEKNIDTFFNYVNLNLCKSLLILWCKLQGVKKKMETLLKKDPYFHRIYYIRSNIKHIFTLKAVLIKAFLMKPF